MPTLLTLAITLLTASPLVVTAHQPAATAAPATRPTAAPLPWPARVPLQPGLRPATLASLPAGVQLMGTIEPCEGPLDDVHVSPWRPENAASRSTADFTLALGRATPPLTDVKPVMESEGSFLFVPTTTPPRPGVSQPDLSFRYISLRPRVDSPTGATSTIERTWFAYYDPLPPRTPPGDPPATQPQSPRALVVFMPGMFGTPDEQVVALIKRLRQEGYAVLRMRSQPSRFTQTLDFALPIEGELPADRIGVIAAELTDRAAEAAYAVQAAVVYVKQERPALAKIPRLAVGFSGGAMLLPIVLAREPGAYAGAVSIAGGVDYLRILATSNYVDWINAVRLRWETATPDSTTPVRASEKRLAELSELYRAAAPLDSANLAPTLKHIPWFILHASGDRAVPAATGEELWELLGKPERTIVKGTHEWIFIALAARYNGIVSWMNARAPVSTPLNRREPESAR